MFQNKIIITVFMNDQPISLEPEIVQFGSQIKQLIKVSNRTFDTISNCFFCLFNTSKYEFAPESFKLEAGESKIITVTLLNKGNDFKHKQFAYIKSKNFSKRITLLSSSQNIEEEKIMRSPSSGIEDLHTLTSRDYRETQKAAYDRVITEKEAYIKRLERRLQEQQQSNRKDRSFTSDGKAKNHYVKDIQQLEEKIIILNQQKDRLKEENQSFRQKIKEYEMVNSRRKGDSQSMDSIQKIIKRKQETIQKLKQENHYLQVQCQTLYTTISEKQEKIRNYEQKNNELLGEMMKSNEVRLKQLQAKIQQQKRKSDKQCKAYKQKVKRLQGELNESHVERNKKFELEQEMSKKLEQIYRLQIKLEEERSKRKQYEEQKKKSLKLHLQNEGLAQQNSNLKEKISNLQKSVDQLREQTIIYRSKVVDQQGDKASRYLQAAFQSCKNENELLRKSKKEIEQFLGQESKAKRLYQNRVQELQAQIRALNDQLNEMKLEVSELQSKSRIYKDESHETIMKLRSENIDLIQKLSFGKKVDNSMQKELKQSQFRLEKSQEQLKRIRRESEITFQKLQQVEEQKLKMSRKIQKYKKQTSKQLKDIADNTLDELKKLKEDKKKLIEKITNLEKQLVEEKQKVLKAEENNRAQIKTRYSQRRTGIKNQRKEIEETFNSYSRNEQIEGLYSELGELRQFKNYINIQMQKMKSLLVNKEDCIVIDDANNFIFSCVNMFDLLHKKISQQSNDREKALETEKQNSFLRGRIVELESIGKLVKNNQNTLQDRFSMIQTSKLEVDKKLMEMVREQMRNQFKKLNEALLISQSKFDLLRKKIYEQYRSRIISILTEKEKNENISKILKLESVLERFVQGLANKSHKEAILSKQVKLKQEARKEASVLKEKCGYLNNLLQSKKGYCSRENVKVFNCSNQPQWHDNIRLEAKSLTLQAENSRLLQQITLAQTQNREYEEQIRLFSQQLQGRQNQITRLKKQVIQIESVNAKELLRRQEDIEELQKKFVNNHVEQLNDNERKSAHDKQVFQMKQQIERKKDIIRNLKEKEKMLEQLIQSNQSSDANRNKGKKETLQQIRMQQSLREFKDSNRELRSENQRLKEEVLTLEQDLEKKNAVIKRMKGEGDEHRIKAVRKDSQQLEKLKNQIRSLKDEIKSINSELDKTKKKKQKQHLESQSQMKKLKNEFLIERRSLQSVIRALSDSIKRLYSDLDIITRKKGFSVNKQVDFQQLLQHPSQIDSIKVYESFQELLRAIKA